MFPEYESDQKWKRAYELFEQIAELAPEGRADVSKLTTEDPEVVRIAMELLQSEETAPPEPPAFERFEIGRLLGSGGMGEVYAAFDKQLHRTVAMKFLASGRLGTGGLIDRFIKEARAASALNHPGIVTVHEVIRSGDSLAIVMELVDGVSLRTFCGTPSPVEKLTAWGKQIAEALAAAHAGGVVHRDIKPENLMIRPDGYVKILDFGVAVKVGIDDDLAGIPIGTLGYMSPEQLQGKPLTGASDIFSLGVVLTEAALGRHPFLQSTARQTTEAILGAEPAFANLKKTKIAEPLGSLLQSMLAKDPEQRPSASAVAAALSPVSPSAKKRVALPVLIGVLAAGVGVPLWLSHAVAPAPVKPVITPFTTYESLEKDPSFSPDGRQIVFAWNGVDGQNWDIYVKSVGQENPRRLTDNPAEDFNPVWSPDGRQIAFLRKTADSVQPQLIVIPAQGGPERELTLSSPLSGVIRHPIAWWMDSQSIVYRKTNVGHDKVGLYRLLLATGEERRLTDNRFNDSQPLPIDEARIGLVQSAGTQTRLCLQILGKDRHCLVPSEKIDGMVLEPDRKHLLYAGESAIWRVPVNGDTFGTPIALVEGSFPELTADHQAKHFAFTKSYVDLNIWRLFLDGRAAQKTIASSAQDSNPDFSPDGSRVLFLSTRTGHSELYTSFPDGSNILQLTHLGGEIASAQWSPEGQSIVFDAIAGDAQFDNVYVIPAQGGTPRRLTDDQLASMQPTWSADGAWIYYSLGRLSFWKIPSAGGTPTELLGGAGLMDPRPSPDGRFLYSMTSARRGGILRRDIVAGTEEAIPGTESAVYRSWALAHGGIYFVKDAAPPQLWFLDFKTRHVRSVMSLPGPPARTARGLAISPDGSTLFYCSKDTEIGDIMLLQGIR